MSENWASSLLAEEQQKPASKDGGSEPNWATRLKRQGATGMINPAAESTGTENALAGIGKAISTAGRGLYQSFHDPMSDDVIKGLPIGTTKGGWNAEEKEIKRRDAPLMDTKHGFWGNVAGTAVTSLPTMAAPGINTYKGATTIGALASALSQPAEDAWERTKNSVEGGIGGFGGQAAGRVLGGLWGMGKGLAAPFFSSGQKGIVADLIKSFEADPSRAVAAMKKDPGEIVAGSLPTAAEASGTTGLATLQKALGQRDPAFKQGLRDRINDQRTARTDAVGSIAGDPHERNFLDANRSKVADDMYGAARRAGFPPEALTPEAQANIAAFQQRIPPSMLEHARELARINGDTMGPEGSLSALHWVKQALDSKISSLKVAGDDTGAKIYTGLKNDLVEGMGKMSPLYDQARLAFIDNSKRINEIDVGQALYKKLAPAINDFGGEAPLSANAYATALREGDAAAQRALDFPGARINDVLTPEQMQVLHSVAKDLARSGNATRNAGTAGSDTIQNVVSQNLINHSLGPLGAPSSWGESTLLQSLLRPLQWAASQAEPRILEKTGSTLMSPEETLKVLLMNRPNPALGGRKLGALGATLGALTPAAYAGDYSEPEDLAVEPKQ
jgi:hypothetical protein